MRTTTAGVKSWKTITPEDPTLVHRVVGTLEYLSALRELDAFLSSATAEEVAAADRIVSSRPQYTIYTRLADRFRSGSQASPQSGPGSLEQRGLMWVVALARLEAGAIVATFTPHPAPFEIIGPSRWEMPAYKQLLMDGALTHTWALASDVNLAAVTRKPPDAEMLAYIRRLNLARSMLSAAARSNALELAAPEWAQLVELDRQLLAMRNRFSTAMSEYLSSQNFTRVESTSMPIRQRNTVKACMAQLMAETKELAAGTASVQTFQFR